MNIFNNRLPLLAKISAMLLLSIPFISTAQKTGVWVKFEVKERMTDISAQQKRNPSFLFSAKSDDKGMNFEMSSVWANDKKRHTYRGQVAWEWTCQKGPSMLIPGEKVTIKGVISNLSGEPSSSICAYAVFGNWGFMKPKSGKSGDECAKHNGSATMIGSFTVPKQPGLNRDGTQNPYIYLKLSLHGGNESSFIDRTITYKWTEVTGQTQPPPPVVTPPPATNAPQAWAEKTVYKVGEPVVVKFKNLPGFNTDWIGIYGAKAYHANEYVEWKYTNGLKEGSMQFSSPRYGAGDYIFRIYENNGYKLLVQSIAFKVVP
ncbi:MAG: hypothetical protein WBC06_09650 [Chitinophagaceae bacterium]